GGRKQCGCPRSCSIYSKESQLRRRRANLEYSWPTKTSRSQTMDLIPAARAHEMGLPLLSHSGAGRPGRFRCRACAKILWFMVKAIQPKLYSAQQSANREAKSSAARTRTVVQFR